MQDGKQIKVSVSAERMEHLEALAALVFELIEQARYIDAAYDPVYADIARELRAIGYRVRDDTPGV